MGRERARTGQFILLCVASLIFFLLSGCTTLRELFILPPAVPVEKVEKPPEPPEPPDPDFAGLERAAQLFKQGDYDGSLKENQRVLSHAGKNPPGDRALFNMGLIYAHGENPKKDYDNSLLFFSNIIMDYPQSPLVEEVKIWIRVLRENEKLKEVIEDFQEIQKQQKNLQSPLEELERAAQLFKKGDYDGSLKENQRILSRAGKDLPGDRALLYMGLIYADRENPKRDYEKSLLFFNKIITDYPQSPLVQEAKIWIRLLRESERLKEIIEKYKEVDIAVEEKQREKTR
jgi:tetratricopeptide (TPR) repeat protein